MSNDYEQTENKIKENVESVLAIYFKDFLNKFDNFNTQLNFANIALGIYQYKYQKNREKLKIIDDVILENYEEQQKFIEKYEKLDKLDAKLSQIEAKLQILNRKMDNIEVKVEEKIKKKYQVIISDTINSVTSESSTNQ